jgi:pimeloyl-ACP methyl ester carboxylesterase
LSTLFTMAKVPFGPQLLVSLLRVRSFRRSLLGFGSCFTDPSYVDGDFAEHFLKPLADERKRHGQLELLRTFERRFVDELAETHARIKAPVLCIWGENDPYFPVGAARRMLATLPKGTQFETIAGARLFPHEDHPEEIARLAREFLSAKPIEQHLPAA